MIAEGKLLEVVLKPSQRAAGGHWQAVERHMGFLMRADAQLSGVGDGCCRRKFMSCARRSDIRCCPDEKLPAANEL